MLINICVRVERTLSSNHNIYQFLLVLRIGPSSLSDCITDKNMGGVKALGQDNSDNYNIISIDQRGMGYVQQTFRILLV